MRKFVFLIIVFFISAALSAGDMATFLNLGFSTDSKYYAFAQYGITADNYNPYAEIYFVDVYNNVFINDGVKKIESNESVQLGQSGFGAFLNLYASIADQVKQLKFDHLLTGRLIYILFNGDTPKEELEFRDFEGGNTYKILLIQKSYGSGESVSASFHLNVFITDKDGNTKSHIVGLPNFKREGVQRYRIKQIMFSPDESALVCVIEKEFYTENGVDIRYMVETFKL